MVGVVIRASEKVAVMVTVSEAAIRLSESEFVSVTVGGVASTVIVILSVPAKVFPTRSAPVTVTV